MMNHHRRKRAATMTSPARDWSSLAPDLVSCIGGIFLSAGDIDYYMALRAVCHPWRAATDNPCGPDPRFRPRGWAMLGSLGRDAAGEQDSRRRLFLNVDTGRFLWKDMPMLGRYVCLATDYTNGLLVLRGADDCMIRILNPFTGHMASHSPSWSSLATASLTIAVDGDTTNSLYTWNSCHDIRNDDDFLTDPTEDRPYSSTARVAFQGRAYKVDKKGKVRAVEKKDQSGPRQVMPMPYEMEYSNIHLGLETYPAPLHNFLVDSSGGEVLLVRLRTSEVDGAAQIFRANLDCKTLHAVTSIGNRAILLGNRCLSVDARNLPGIECNCIYYIGGETSVTRTIYIYRLEDESHEELFQSSPYERLRSPALPLSLLQVLMDYPKRQVESRFGSAIACTTWEY